MEMPQLKPRRFDLIVIGSGSAAGAVASRCRGAGWTVAMIDKRPFGGTCALRGPFVSAQSPAAYTIGFETLVGLREADARAQGLRFSATLQDTASWYSSRRLGEEASACKVLVEEKTGRILGAHLLGPHADEVINLFTLAMRAGMTADAFKTMIWAYPTNGSDTAYMV